jgi:citronellol/citronellal dehydrogenase
MSIADGQECEGNISKSADRRRMVDEAVEQLGPIDILVNNAAVTFYVPFDDFPEKRYNLMFEVQVRAPFELAQFVVPGMRERRQGWILNITSRAGVHPQGPPYLDIYKRGFSVYGMVKAALDRFTTGLAAEVYDDGIAVNSLAPWDNVMTPGAGAHDLVEGSQPLLAELQRRPQIR